MIFVTETRRVNQCQLIELRHQLSEAFNRAGNLTDPEVVAISQLMDGYIAECYALSEELMVVL